MVARLRLANRDQRGMTLLELVVVMGILSFVLLVFTSILASVQTTYQRESSRSSTADQARLGIEELDREIRSGNVFYDPANESSSANGIYPNMSLRIYSQTNVPTRSPGNRCVQWRIMSQQLQRRDWAITWRDDPTHQVTGWRVVAEGIKNQVVSPQVAAFTLDNSQATFGGRIIKILLLVNNDTTKGRTTSIGVSITGRDTEFGYPTNVCNDIPPY